MSKAVLVMDMPNACIDCPCHFAYDDGTVFCGKKNKELICDDIETYKPDWCPLVELPEKKITGIEPTQNYYAKGWNACLDEIMKGCEE